MTYYVYVIYSQENSRFYRGMTQNLDRRINEHNRGNVKSTKSFIPWILIYSEECSSRSEAREREKFLKSGDGRKYINSLL